MSGLVYTLCVLFKFRVKAVNFAGLTSEDLPVSSVEDGDDAKSDTHSVGFPARFSLPRRDPSPVHTYDLHES